MPPAVRTSVVALTVSAVTVAAATAFVPPRVRLGSYSFTCDTALRHHRFDPIATPICQIASSYRLRATVGIAALLAALSLVPMLLQRTRFAASRPAYVAWGSTLVIVAVVTITLLAAVGARFENVFLDL